MAPTAQPPLPAFGSSVAFIDVLAKVTSESRLCWDDNEIRNRRRETTLQSAPIYGGL
jgi:hypothetical protein